MPLAIRKLKGMTPELEKKLNAAGVKSADDLFNMAITPAARQELADKGGVPVEAILELANRADLARIKGVAGAYSDMLEEAGVDTIKELGKRNAENLAAKLEEINNVKHYVKKTPSARTLQNWILQAHRRRKFLKY